LTKEIIEEIVCYR